MTETNELKHQTYWHRRTFKIGKSLFINIPADYIKESSIKRGEIGKITSNENGDLIICFARGEDK